MRAAWQDVLDFWFGRSVHDPVEASERQAFWFSASDEVDARVRERFESTLEAAARGELDAWIQEPRSALALVVVLDQLPRNIGRGSARAFAHDAQALRTVRGAIAAGHLERLSPIEQAFLILPFQHSESLEDQRESVRLSAELVRRAPAAWQPVLESNLGFARQHLELIERFGRFPHRNRVLGREASAEERAFLAAGAASFGQGDAP